MLRILRNEFYFILRRRYLIIYELLSVQFHIRIQRRHFLLYALGKDTSGNIVLYKITVEEQYANYKNAHDKRFQNLKYIQKWLTTSAALLVIRVTTQNLQMMCQPLSTVYPICSILSIRNIYLHQLTLSSKKRLTKLEKNSIIV